jgi:hypothetical protein
VFVLFHKMWSQTSKKTVGERCFYVLSQLLLRELCVFIPLKYLREKIPQKQSTGSFEQGPYSQNFFKANS